MSDKPANIVTPYACAKVVNRWLQEDGIQKKLPPQMFYQYTSPKKNYIPTVEVDGKRCVQVEDLKAWYDKYTKKTAPVSEDVVEVDEDQLELDFESEGEEDEKA